MSEDDPHPEFQFPVKIEGDESAVPAEYRPLYRKDPADGSLQIIPTLARQMEAPGLKTALQKARADAREVERREKEKHKKTLELLGVESPDEVPLKIDELKRASSGAVDAVRAETEHRFKATYQAQISEVRAANEKLKQTLAETLIDGEATRAISQQKGSVRALMPHVKNSMKLVDENGALRPRVVDSDGNVRHGHDGQPMTVSDLITEFKRDAEFASLFESSGSSVPEPAAEGVLAEEARAQAPNPTQKKSGRKRWPAPNLRRGRSSCAMPRPAA